jgi:hypothetical protein
MDVETPTNERRPTQSNTDTPAGGNLFDALPKTLQPKNKDYKPSNEWQQDVLNGMKKVEDMKNEIKESDQRKKKELEETMDEKVMKRMFERYLTERKEKIERMNASEKAVLDVLSSKGIGMDKLKSQLEKKKVDLKLDQIDTTSDEAVSDYKTLPDDTIDDYTGFIEILTMATRNTVPAYQPPPIPSQKLRHSDAEKLLQQMTLAMKQQRQQEDEDRRQNRPEPKHYKAPREPMSEEKPNQSNNTEDQSNANQQNAFTFNKEKKFGFGALRTIETVASNCLDSYNPKARPGDPGYVMLPNFHPDETVHASKDGRRYPLERVLYPMDLRPTNKGYLQTLFTNASRKGVSAMFFNDMQPKHFRDVGDASIRVGDNDFLDISKLPGVSDYSGYGTRMNWV